MMSNNTMKQQTLPQTHSILMSYITAVFLVSALCSGCVVVDDRDDRYDDRQQTGFIEEDTIVEDDTIIEDDTVIEDEEEEVEESSMEEIIEEEEEETTMTTTTVVETPGMEATEEVTCSAEDQGFGDAALVDAFVVVPPEGCDWSEMSIDLPEDTGLGFVDVVDDVGYTALFTCDTQSISSDIDWASEVVVYLSGWVPAGSNPEFEWAVSGTSDEVVLGLVSDGVCSDDVEFYQNAFIAPRRMQRPRVISCTMPADCP